MTAALASGPCMMMASSWPFGKRLRRSCTTASAFAASKSSLTRATSSYCGFLARNSSHPLARRICGEVPANAHDIGDLGALAAEGLIEQLALEPPELDVVRPDISEYVCLASSEAGFVVHFDQGNLRLVHELDAGNNPVTGRREKDEVFLLRDKVLEVGELGRDVAAVAVNQVVGEAELLGAVLKAGLEVRVDRRLEVGDRDADLLVRRRRSSEFRIAFAVAGNSICPQVRPGRTPKETRRRGRLAHAACLKGKTPQPDSLNLISSLWDMSDSFRLARSLSRRSCWPSKTGGNHASATPLLGKPPLFICSHEPKRPAPEYPSKATAAMRISPVATGCQSETPKRLRPLRPPEEKDADDRTGHPASTASKRRAAHNHRGNGGELVSQRRLRRCLLSDRRVVPDMAAHTDTRTRRQSAHARRYAHLG